MLTNWSLKWLYSADDAAKVRMKWLVGETINIQVAEGLFTQ